MGADGNEVDKGDMYSSKVTHNLTKPDMCIIADEVSGDIFPKGDVMVENELLLI